MSKLETRENPTRNFVQFGDLKVRELFRVVNGVNMKVGNVGGINAVDLDSGSLLKMTESQQVIKLAGNLDYGLENTA